MKRRCGFLKLMLLAWVLSAGYACAQAYVAIEVYRIRYNETSHYKRVQVRLSAMTFSSEYSSLDAARLITPKGARLTMLNRRSSRSLSLSRYVPYETLDEVNGIWKIELYADNKLLDTLSCTVDWVAHKHFPRYALFPKLRYKDDPLLAFFPSEYGLRNLDAGGAEWVKNENHDSICRLDRNKITRLASSQVVKCPTPPIIYNGKGIESDVTCHLWIKSESEVWAIPDAMDSGRNNSLQLSEISSTTIDSSKNNVIELLEDEVGISTAIYYTGGSSDGTFQLEISTDLQIWTPVNLVTSMNSIVAFPLTMDEEKAFFRVITKTASTAKPKE